MNEHLEILRNELVRVIGGLDERQTQLRPGGDASRWSIQQTIGHLLKTYAATEVAINARIKKGTGTRARPTIAQRVGQVVIIRGGLFPPGRKSPEVVCPAADETAMPSGVLIERVNVALKNLDLRVAEAGELFGTQQKAISHIILGPLSLTQWTRFHLVHGRHHMRFMSRVREEFGV